MANILGQCMVYIAGCIFLDSVRYILHGAYFGTVCCKYCMVHILGQCTVYTAWCIFWDSVRYILHGAYFGTVYGIYCMVPGSMH
jgi:hypothetical protein